MSRPGLFSPACFVAASVLGLQLSALGQLPSPAPPGTPSEAPSGLTVDTIIAALNESGFKAERADPTYDVWGEIKTILAPTSLDAIIKISPCRDSPTSICALTFTAVYTGFPGVSAERIAALNASSFAHVYQLQAHGIRVQYVYVCEGFRDASFVPMVLKEFTWMVVKLLPPPKTDAPARATEKAGVPAETPR